MGEEKEHAAYLSSSSFQIPDNMVESSWTEHAAFAFWLVEALSPQSFVELGVHNGYSYFTFCQAAAELGLSTACYGVDTWQGDEHAGAYDGSVFTEVVKLNEAYRSFSTLLPMTFSEALNYFADKSIDILHIDGRHFYEDVKEDFETWLPKMGQSGIVLLHDTNVRERDFGVWRFFESLAEKHPVFNFIHGHGLGVVAVGSIPPSLAVLFEASNPTKNNIRAAYARLGENLRHRWAYHKLKKAVLDSKYHANDIERRKNNEEEQDKHERSPDLFSALDVFLRRLAHDYTEVMRLIAQSKRPVAVSKLPKYLRRRLSIGRSVEYNNLINDYEILSNSPLFDTKWYVASYKNVAEKGEDPIHHFIKYGNKYNLSPGPYFDTKAYFEKNPDVKIAGKNPLLDFIETSASEKRSLGREDRLLADFNPPVEVSTRRSDERQAGCWPIEMPDLFQLRIHTPSCRVAVVMHVYYAEDCEELLRDCKNISEPYDIFISLVKDRSDQLYAPLKQRLPDAFIYIFENRGRDILSFMAFAATGVLSKYPLICKLHTKRSPHRDDGTKWRRHLLDGILPSEDGVRQLIKAFDTDPDIGLVVADGQVFSGLDVWLGNIGHATRFAPLLGYDVSETFELPFAGGSIFWLRSFLLYDLIGLNASPESYEPEPLRNDGSLAHTMERFFSVSCAAAGMRIATTSTILKNEPSEQNSGAGRSPRVVAFYLPQFHPVAENDAWWGRGFTEWTNVTKATPLFFGHRQPRLPGELGFTDLRLAETRDAQASLAKASGLSAFCYYYYWFSGGKRMLHRPIDEVLASGKPDFPFMICWANEPWSRNWDGHNAEVLLAQDYPTGWEEEFANDIAPILKDSRYLRTEGDKPLPMLFIYRIMHLPEPETSVALLRDALQAAGVGDVHLAAGWFRLGEDAALPEDPAELGLDAYFEFPPHEIPTVRVPALSVPPALTGTVYKYGATVTAALAEREAAHRRHRAVMMGWDNTARRGSAAQIFHGATPSHFRRWVRGALQKTMLAQSDPGRLLLVNAWNEWAEGSCLEPDRDFGRGWLDALRSALGQPGQTMTKPSDEQPSIFASTKKNT